MGCPKRTSVCLYIYISIGMYVSVYLFNYLTFIKNEQEGCAFCLSEQTPSRSGIRASEWMLQWTIWNQDFEWLSKL